VSIVDLMNSAKKPRAVDVNRWVAILGKPMPSPYMREDTRIAKREKDNARASLRSWDLGDDGLPKVAAVTS
jgi:hypothetical protein